MRRSRIFLFTALAVMLCASGRDALACSCMRISICEALGQAQAVFIGSVLSVSTIKPEKEVSWGQTLFRLSVEQSFFGVEGREVEVVTGSGGGDCGYGFQRGVSYLVYANRDSTTGRLTTNICTRTAPLGEAAEDLAYIREAIKGRPGVIIDGVARRYDPQGQFGPPLGNLKIVIKGNEREYRATTDEEGKYRVANLPAGKYEVRLELADGMWTRTPKQEFTVGDRGCARADFLVETDGRIAGKVIDEKERGMPQVHLTVLKVDPADPQKAVNADYAMTEEDGRFLFRGLPPGRYLFRVTHARLQLYRPGYHPGVQTTAEAYAVDVGEGQKVEGIELRLLPAAREYELQGIVVWPDGQPAADIEVAWGVPNENFRLTTKTDSQGRFTVRLFAGYKFWVNAAIQEPGGAWHSSAERPPIEPNNRMEPLKLVLKPQER